MILKARKKRLYVRKTHQSEEVVREIEYLRSVAKEAADRYSLRVHARLANIVRILKSPNRKGRRVRKPNGKTLCEMLSRICSLKIKPKKGRAKDFARIESITKKLDDLMPTQL